MIPRRNLTALLAASMMAASMWAGALEISGQTPVDKVVVRKSDTLWAIAGSHLKDPRKWRQIWKLNQEAIKNPDLIYPDQIILLPRPFTAITSKEVSGPLPVINAHVISVLKGTSASGLQTVLVIDKGTQDGVKTGLVMTLYHENNSASTAKHLATPGPGFGQLVVFRTYDKQSYASTLPSNLVVRLMDNARTTVIQNTASNVTPDTVTPRQPVTVKQHIKRQGRDARACLRRGSNREIAACAEKYR